MSASVKEFAKKVLFGIIGERAREVFLCLYRGGFIPNFKHPVTFQDKIIWLKYHAQYPLAYVLADKVKVRELVAQRIGAQYLSEYHGIYRSTEEIDFNRLPDRFVLKANHGSCWTIICEDKSKIDWPNTTREMKSWLKSDYSSMTHESCYHEIEPRIICEEFLSDEDGKVPSDYKFFCFHGEPFMIQVDFSRFESHKQNYYDTEWKRLPITHFVSGNNKTDAQEPERLDEMLDIASKLSSDLPFARIDLYHLPDRIVFGEITLFPMSGNTRFTPKIWNRILGDRLDLSQIPEDYIV